LFFWSLDSKIKQRDLGQSINHAEMDVNEFSASQVPSFFSKELAEGMFG